jgi:hypothetical protein
MLNGELDGQTGKKSVTIWSRSYLAAIAHLIKFSGRTAYQRHDSLIKRYEILYRVIYGVNNRELEPIGSFE